jgi:hypothetical protein
MLLKLSLMDKFDQAEECSMVEGSSAAVQYVVYSWWPGVKHLIMEGPDLFSSVEYQMTWLVYVNASFPYGS